MTAATAIRTDYFGLPALQSQLANYLGRETSNRSHLSAVPSVSTSEAALPPRQETYDVENNVANTTQDRTPKQPALIDRISEREFARIVSDALQAHYGPMKASAKCCANDAGASVPTAKNWLAGLCPPSSVYLKRLEAKVPGLAAEMRRLTAMEIDLDPEFERNLSEAIRLLMRRA